RKHQPDTIKRIFEYAELFDSQDSLDNATSAAGGLKKVWPEFALAGWNDWTNHVHDDFYTWDQLKEGRKLEFDTGDGGALLGRDSKEERLEELVVIYSNSDPVRPRETTVVRLDGIPGLPGDVDFIPKVDASNAGCWRWEGTSKITTTDTYGLKIETSATVTFDRVRATGESPDGAGQELYSTKAQAGPATYSINGPFLGTCDVTGSGTAAMADSDGIMNIRFNQPEDPDNRVVLSGDGNSTMMV